MSLTQHNLDSDDSSSETSEPVTMQITSKNISKVFFLTLLFVSYSLEEECTIPKSKCVWTKAGQPSILVNASSGGFCNQLFNAVVLITMNCYMNMSIFMPKKTLNIIKTVFPYMEILPAEDHICNFTEDYGNFLKNLKIKENLQIVNLVRKRERNPHKEFEKAPEGHYIIPDKYMVHDYVAEVYAQDSYRTMPEDSMGPDWKVFYERPLKLLEERNWTTNHAILIYHPGFSFRDVRTKGFVKKFEANFKFAKKYDQAAARTLSKIQAKLNYKNPIFIGIHVRRTDFVTYELSMNYEPIRPSYYLQAMELYRGHALPDEDLIFVIISDDVAWCKQYIKKKQKNVFVVSNPELDTLDGIGHDLAVISQCNHTIISRGSFSYFSSIFAGGSKVLPCHFDLYKKKNDFDNVICNRHPLQQPIDKFYTYQS